VYSETQRVVETLGCPYPSKPVEALINEEDVTATYRVAKESTSSSPSGRHIGHYKAAIKDPTLASLHATMMSIPFQTGVVP
jgi:hypothetical protein